MLAGNHNYSNGVRKFRTTWIQGGGNYNVFIPELNENETDGGKFKNLGMKKMEMENFTTSRGIRSNFFLFSFFFCRMEL